MGEKAKIKRFIMKALCFYAQTFPTSPKGKYPDASDLFKLIQDLLPRTQKLIIYFSSLHFGTDNIGNKYLHFNNQPVTSIGPFLNQLRTFLSKYSNSELEFRFMLGGAGGAYQALYSDFDTYYQLLQNFISQHNFISGMDLDIEEMLDTDPDEALIKVKTLIRRLHGDTHGFMERERGFSITLAPVATSLQGSGIGMGGFSYKTLLQSAEGKMISGLNVQIYGCFTEDTFKAIAKNNIPLDLLTIGMLGDEFTSSTEFATAMSTIEDAIGILERTQGFVMWESGDSAIDPYQWARAILRASRNKENRTQPSSWWILDMFGKLK